MIRALGRYLPITIHTKNKLRYSDGSDPRIAPGLAIFRGDLAW